METPYINKRTLEDGFAAPWNEKDTTATKQVYRSRARLPRPRFLALFNRAHSKPILTRSTSALDGLRGIAAVSVCLRHYTDYFWLLSSKELAERGLVSDWTSRIPFVRVGGPTSITVFFAAGGFVLTQRNLMLIREGNYEQVRENVARRLLQRPIRLYVHAIVSVSLVLLCLLVGFDVRYTSIEKTTWLQLVHFWKSSKKYINPWVVPTNTNGYSTYNFPTWTIPIEVQNGTMCYIMMLLLSKTVSYRVRTIILSSFLALGIVLGMRFPVSYLTGILLADYDLEFPQNSKASGSQRQWVDNSINILLGLFFCYIGGVLDDKTGPELGRKICAALTPSSWSMVNWWVYVCGTVLVYCAIRKDRLKAVLNHRVLQYLGTVSFAMYLIHIPIWSIFFSKLYTQILPELIGTRLAWYAFVIMHPPTLLLAAETWQVLVGPVADSASSRAERYISP